MKIEPIDNGVVVKRDAAAKQSPGGITIPEGSRDTPQRGTVMAVGPKCQQVKVKDRVVLGAYAGSKVDVGGQELLVLSEMEILGILKD